MNEVLKTIYARSSVRAYKDEQVPDDLIREVINAGFHAACGINAQATRFAVVSDRKKMKEFSDIGKKAYLLAKGPRINDRMKAMLSDDSFNIFFDAPSVIFVFTAPGALTAKEDASLALGNMMIAARSLGLGTCWIGFAGALSNDPGFVRDTRSEGMEHHGSLIIGYPAKDQGPTPRKDVEILNWIR